MIKKSSADASDAFLTSSWDQFCEFTSLIGFRLLHSNQPIWLRYCKFGKKFSPKNIALFPTI